MQVERGASSVRVRVRLLDALKDPVTGKAFNTAGLTVQTLAHDGVGFATKTLVEGTIGTWTSNGWVEIGDGVYEYGLPDALVVAGKETVIRARGAAADEWQYGVVSATEYAEVNMSQATPGGSTIGAQLDKAGTATATSNSTSIVGLDDFSQTNSTAQYPDQGLFDPEAVSEGPYYTGTQWSIVFRPIGTIPEGEEITFALKADIDDDDSESVLEITYTVTGPSTAVTVVNGVAPEASLADKATITGTDWVDPDDDVTKKQATLVVQDILTAEIAAATYQRGFKRVGTSEVLVQDEMTVQTPVTKAFAP